MSISASSAGGAYVETFPSVIVIHTIGQRGYEFTSNRWGTRRTSSFVRLDIAGGGDAVTAINKDWRPV
jgi:hypothetical protein